MALTKPVLLSVNSFDASTEYNFVFTGGGSTQISANRLKIINNETGVVVYNQLQESYVLRHTLEASTLTNGLYYSAQIQTQDGDGNVSAWSESVQFYCYTTPTLNITNLPATLVVESPSFTFEATYDQEEDERLNSYAFNLYNSAGILVSTSGVKYVGSSVAPPTYLTYEFSGFNDGTIYFIEVQGVTSGGTTITTGLIQFYVDYIEPSAYALLELQNNCDEGYITISSNVIDVEGVATPDPPTYIDDTLIDLSDEGSNVVWSEGFVINKDFTFSIWGRNFNPNTNIVTIKNPSGYSIEINYRQSEDLLGVYIEAVIKDTINDVVYYVYSDTISTPTTTSDIIMWLRRIDNVYQIKLEDLGVA